MELSITTLIVLAATIGFLSLVTGFTGGFLYGTLNRVFFRHRFREWVDGEMIQMQEYLQTGLGKAQEQAQQMVATAHAQTQTIYKAAAEHAAAVKLPGVKTQQKGPLN